MIVLAAMLLLGMGSYAAMAQVEPAGVLTVTPTSGFSCSGLRSDIAGKSKIYTLTNTGTAPLNWTVTLSVSYWSLQTPSGYLSSGGGGTLEAGASVPVTVTVSRMPPSGDNPAGYGLYFKNATNGLGNTSRWLSIYEKFPAEMRVLGGDRSGIWIKGDTLSQRLIGEWMVRNDGDATLHWTVQADQPWLTLEASSNGLFGSGGAGAYANQQANALPIGSHISTVTFTGSGAGLPVSQQYHTRMVTLNVVWPGDINADFAVDVADLLWMVGSWGKSLNQPGYNYRCDINRDHTVDMADLLLFMANWGEGLEGQPE
jgi:hypothetical protein